MYFCVYQKTVLYGVFVQFWIQRDRFVCGHGIPTTYIAPNTCPVTELTRNSFQIFFFWNFVPHLGERNLFKHQSHLYVISFSCITCGYTLYSLMNLRETPELSLGLHTWNPRTREAAARERWIWDKLWLHREFQANLGYTGKSRLKTAAAIQFAKEEYGELEGASDGWVKWSSQCQMLTSLNDPLPPLWT